MTEIANFRQARAWNGPFGAHRAAHADRYDAMLAELDDVLFDAAAVTVADRVLDVGCGSGATTRIAARRAARSHVVGVDISAPLLRLARERTAAERLTNVAYVEADAQVHPFPAAGYDVVVSRGGVMFFADHAVAFANLARALRPGGRLVFVCPRPAGPDSEEVRAFAPFARLLGTPDADAVAAHTAMMSLSDPAAVQQALDGYKDVTVERVDVGTVWGRDAADAAGFVLSRDTSGRTFSPAVRAELADALSPYESPRGVRLRTGVWLVRATRPE
ncbi:class I SAM-dependent methyltransferase [Streptomyces sp. NPDC006997]|uniref:class I SAM-dependent methyltransferase n=1 Tax=Streptomyces sp. NPDC006997 TaxID=3155356 RepID=UPI0033C0CCC1